MSKRTATPPDLMKCECEHDNHFAEFATGHPYLAKTGNVQMVDTIYGKFPVCTTCRDTCMKDILA